LGKLVKDPATYFVAVIERFAKLMTSCNGYNHKMKKP